MAGIFFEKKKAAEIINGATIRRDIADEDEFRVAMAGLDLTDENEPKHIYSFVNGSEGTICFAGDWEVIQ